MERIVLDVGEGPAHRAAPGVRSSLDDVRAPSATDLLREDVGRRVVPQDAPGIEGRIVEAQRRAVPVAGAGQRRNSRVAIRQPRDHPDILDGAPLEYPAGVNLASPVMRRAIVE